MKTKMAWLLFLVLVSTGSSAYSLGPPAYKGRAEIEFFATSTLHNFSGNVSSNAFDVNEREVEESSHYGPHARSPKESTVYDWDIEVEVLRIDTKNKKRNKDMYRMFDWVSFPVIKGSFKGIDLADLASYPEKLPYLPFVLTIKDVSHEIHAHVKNVEKSDKTLRFNLDFDVSLKQFNLKPPSVLGFIKVGDRIAVNCAITLSH